MFTLTPEKIKNQTAAPELGTILNSDDRDAISKVIIEIILESTYGLFPAFWLFINYPQHRSLIINVIHTSYLKNVYLLEQDMVLIHYYDEMEQLNLLSAENADSTLNFFTLLHEKYEINSPAINRGIFFDEKVLDFIEASINFFIKSELYVILYRFLDNVRNSEIIRATLTTKKSKFFEPLLTHELATSQKSDYEALVNTDDLTKLSDEIIQAAPFSYALRKFYFLDRSCIDDLSKKNISASLTTIFSKMGEQHSLSPNPAGVATLSTDSLGCKLLQLYYSFNPVLAIRIFYYLLEASSSPNSVYEANHPGDPFISLLYTNDLLNVQFVKAYSDGLKVGIEKRHPYVGYANTFIKEIAFRFDNNPRYDNNNAYITIIKLGILKGFSTHHKQENIKQFSFILYNFMTKHLRQFIDGNDLSSNTRLSTSIYILIDSLCAAGVGIGVAEIDDYTAYEYAVDAVKRFLTSCGHTTLEFLLAAALLKRIKDDQKKLIFKESISAWLRLTDKDTHPFMRLRDCFVLMSDSGNHWQIFRAFLTNGDSKPLYKYFQVERGFEPKDSFLNLVAPTYETRLRALIRKCEAARNNLYSVQAFQAEVAALKEGQYTELKGIRFPIENRDANLANTNSTIPYINMPQSQTPSEEQNVALLISPSQHIKRSPNPSAQNNSLFSPSLSNPDIRHQRAALILNLNDEKSDKRDYSTEENELQETPSPGSAPTDVYAPSAPQ